MVLYIITILAIVPASFLLAYNFSVWTKRKRHKRDIERHSEVLDFFQYLKKVYFVPGRALTLNKFSHTPPHSVRLSFSLESATVGLPEFFWYVESDEDTKSLLNDYLLILEASVSFSHCCNEETLSLEEFSQSEFLFCQKARIYVDLTLLSEERTFKVGIIYTPMFDKDNQRFLGVSRFNQQWAEGPPSVTADYPLRALGTTMLASRPNILNPPRHAPLFFLPASCETDVPDHPFLEKARAAYLEFLRVTTVPTKEKAA